MSTRWYPLYQKGNPQLRVFLPNFWMKMAKPKYENYPKNRVMFIVSTEMSRIDVKNYLEKIYNIPVVSVRIFIQQGDTKLAPKKQYVIKDDDYKVAWVTLPKEMNFEFPDVNPTDTSNKDLEDEKKQAAALKESQKQFLSKRQIIPEVPGWFT